ncbi:MAG: OadG family protein [Oscillospiraceae bacterium]
MEVSSLFVCVMGMGVTFVGLTALIFLIQLMGKLLGPGKKAAEPAPAAAVEAEDRGALIAAISAVLAEEMGTDVSGLRILELKRVS